MCKRIKVDSIEFCIRTDKEDLVDSKYEKVELRLYLNVCLYEKAEVRKSYVKKSKRKST